MGPDERSDDDLIEDLRAEVAETDAQAVEDTAQAGRQAWPGGADN